MRFMMTGLALATALVSATAQAQESVYWSAPPPASSARYAYFPMGTPIRLSTRIALSTRDNRPGDRFYLTVAEPLVHDGTVVVPAGSLAVGEVMRADRSAMFGQRGEMAVRLLYVQTPSGPIALSGKVDRAGKKQEMLAIGGFLFVSWPMMFIRGTSARLPADSVVTAYLADDLRFPMGTPSRTVALVEPVPAAPPASFDPAAFSGVRVARR